MAEHTCTTCKNYERGWVPCPRCGGDKKIQSETCYYCHGDGKVVCPACRGTGKVSD